MEWTHLLQLLLPCLRLVPFGLALSYGIIGGKSAFSMLQQGAYALVVGVQLNLNWADASNAKHPLLKLL